MQLSLLLSLMAFTALARWARDDTLVRAAETWRTSLLHERCHMIAGRLEAGRRNITAAAAALDVSPAVALERWGARHPEVSCPAGAGGLTWDVHQESHVKDRGVNWVMVWREGV